MLYPIKNSNFNFLSKWVETKNKVKKLTNKQKLTINCKVRNKLNCEDIILFCATFVLHYRHPQAISNKLLI